MNATQDEKAVSFRALHDRSGAFIIPNPWDVGSARALAGLGFPGTRDLECSSGLRTWSQGSGLTRDEALAHARLIVDATDLPVSADLEKGFGDSPETVAETIGSPPRQAWLDARSRTRPVVPERPLYDSQLAVERIAAARTGGTSLPFPFVLTARAHNLLYATPSLDATIRLLQAFEEAAPMFFSPRIARLSRRACSLCGGFEAGQFHGGNQREIVFS